MSKWDWVDKQETPTTHYYKVQGLDGKYYIVRGFPSGPSVKGGLTKEEADAYLKLLKE